ncbi:MAG: alpha-2-macroglobulin family protein, partial [Spirochaetaceae bacterium]|nr:alpha-2-macroglobulin family protein [Spirochaetaceae bacterium]
GWVTTERPVYRPDEAVHVVGWAREWLQGRIGKYRDRDLEAIVAGPGEQSWRYPVDLGAWGAFAFDFAEKDLPTGDYSVSLAIREGPTLSSAQFRILAYRVPLFEVNISGPDRVSLDAPFELLLTADYYSGGRMTGESVTWDIEQYPWGVKAVDYPLFAFSTDERFGSGSRWGTVETGSRDSVLDQDGASRLSLDPRKERDVRARRYVVTGTVRGADRQTVVASKSVYALPPFSLGVRADRVVKGGSRVEGDFLVLDFQEKPEAGREVQVRLIQRQWHSYVSETDFTTGEAKYVSESVDVPLAEKRFVSGLEPQRLSFDVAESGIYILEASARDHLGRRIVVSTDLFLSGEGAVAWERKSARTFEIAGDKAAYKPGEMATLVLKSPYNEGFALVVVEAPDANAYSVVRIKDGSGLFELPVRADMAPGIPIQALLYRGRAGSASVDASRRADLGKPASVGASYALKVLPVANQVAVTLEHPAKGRPGTNISVMIFAKDEGGRPLDGEATLWLVDKAVLSLGTERELDPLGAFLDKLGSSVRIVDTRNRSVGYLPVSEISGGDGGDDLYMMGELFNRSTVRKNFKTVPIFKTGIPVRNGAAVVEVALPDNLTDFAVRAVVTSGFDRFGSARSVLPVRLALTLQSALPRFVRPYDDFTAGGTLRVVEGSGGPAVWGYRLKGLAISGDEGPQSARPVTLPEKDAVKLELPLSVPFNLQPGPEAALIGFAAERSSDGAKDAFEVELPVRPDAQKRVEFALVTLDGKTAADLPRPSMLARAGTLTRSVLVARDPRLLAIGRGFAYLKDYPHGCLEQRTSQLFPSVAMRDFATSLGLPGAVAGGAGGAGSSLKAIVRDFERYAASCQADSGLFSYWPKSEPSVSLSAYVVEFLHSCAAAGLSADDYMLARAQEGLSKSLRSDFPVWDARWADFERVQAFGSLEAAGIWEASYAGSFLDRAESLDLVSKARLLTVLKNRGMASGSKAVALEKSLVASLVTKKERGKDVLAGLRDFQAGGRVLLTETRAVAALLEALAPQDKGGQRTALLSNWLISRSGAQGWGSTMDTVCALRALAAWLGNEKADEIQVEVKSGGKSERLSTKGARLASFELAGFDSGQASLVKGADKGSVTLLVTTSYTPAARGGALKAVNAGFAIDREFLPVLEDGSLGKGMPAAAGATVEFSLDDIVEEHATLVNFEDRSFVAVEIPLAAGMEMLDPRLAGAPREATPFGTPTLQPSYSMQLDDKVAYYYDSLPKGTYHFFFRVRASFVGEYTAPQAKAELMYDQAVSGLSAGTNLAVRRR